MEATVRSGLTGEPGGGPAPVGSTQTLYMPSLCGAATSHSRLSPTHQVSAGLDPRAAIAFRYSSHSGLPKPSSPSIRMWSKVWCKMEALDLCPLGRARAVGDHGEGYAATPEATEGFDRAGDQHGHLVSLLPVRSGEVTGEVREIEAQLAQGPEDHTGAGRHKVRAAYAVALRVGPVPLARPEYFLKQGAGVEPGDAGCRVGADQAPARVDAGAVVDDGIVEVDEHRAGRDHGFGLWGHRVLATNRADRSGEVAGQLPHYKSTTKRSRRLDSDLTKGTHKDIVVCMIPGFNSEGLLPPGVHWANWDELMVLFGNSSWRQDLMDGLRAALENLKRAGCRTVYVNGSFVMNKYVPNDYDACWEEAGVEP